MDIVGIAVLWIHLSSVVMLIGAALYGALSNTALSNAFRSYIYLGMALLAGTGFYQFFAKNSFPKGYHMYFGIKMLLVMHIFAVFLLIALGRGDEAKQKRWLTGLAGSGLLAILLGTILHSLSQGV